MNYWAEALNTATVLLNRRPCRASSVITPHELLLGVPPRYDDLRVFGCLCFPNTASVAPHKLHPRSTPCVFLGYPNDHRGYRCLDIQTRRVITSRHVVFDESSFPFRDTPSPSVPPRALTPVDDDVALRHAVRLHQGRTNVDHPAVTASSPGVVEPSASTPPAVAVQGSPTSSTPLLEPHASPAPVHHMVTRGKAGIFKPNPKYALQTESATSTTPTTTVSPIPSSVRAALKDPNWRAAMHLEFDALQANNTWTLQERPRGARIITGKWVFKHKWNPDGSLDRYKARWVVRGFNQRPGIDFGDTFSPVVKPATIRTVLTLVASKRWPTHQLNVSNAFLHGDLHETVYCSQPTGFEHPERPDAVCLLSRSLYGLRQAPRQWFLRFVAYVTSLGFVQSRADTSLFVLRQGNDTAYLLLYVDDMILSASSSRLLQHIIDKLKLAFAIKDLGPLRFFLGIDVQRDEGGFFLSQGKYA